MRDRAETVRMAFDEQAMSCRQLGSPFTARLLDLLADRLDGDTPVGSAVLGWQGDPRPDALALRVAGALHGLVLDGTDPGLKAAYPPAESDPETLWPAVDAALRAHAGRVIAWIGHPPQTNEVARSGIVLPGLLAIARETGLPLRLFEFGSSGGLNLLCDRFRYDYGSAGWGNPGSPVRLAPRARGPAPPLDGTLRIVERAGCDANPLDPRNPQDRLRLMAYTWPDQTERLRRQSTAIDVAAASDIRVVRHDAADWVENRLGAAQPGTCTVLLHTVVWQYLPDVAQGRIETTLKDRGNAATGNAPLAWLHMEDMGKRGNAELSLTLWPGGTTRVLAACDWHGRWIEWLG